MKMIVTVLALIVALASTAYAQVGRQIGNLEDLLMAIKDSHNLFVCVEITKDPRAPQSTTQTCSRIEKITRWSIAGLGPGTAKVWVDMDYPALSTSRITHLIYFEGSISDGPGWMAMIEYSDEVNRSQKFIRSVSIDKLLLY